MDWVPVVKSHHVPHCRWSNKHPVRIIEDLISPHIDQEDSRDFQSGVLIAANGPDLLYVSSDNTVTVLLGVLEPGFTVPDDPEISISGPAERTGLAQDVALLPNLAGVQVFETQLSVSGISVASDDTVILHTMYHVILLRKICGKYEQELLHRSEEHVLSAVEGHDGGIYILTISTLWVRRVEEGITPLIDVSDMWRVTPVERTTLLQYKQWFIVAESSALHFINETEHHLVCTIPTEYLEFTEKFLNITVIEDEVITVTSNYVIIYEVSVQPTAPCLTVKLKLSHNVGDAHSAQFYPQKGPVSDTRSQTSNFRFSVVSDQKCSFFNFGDCPDSDLVTSIIPYKYVHMKYHVTAVLDKSSYLNLTVDKRNNITKRINSGICGAFFSPSSGSHFVLNKHKDLFSEEPLIDDLCEREKLWNSWLSSMPLEEEYWIDYHPVDVAYDTLLKQGLAVTRSQTLEDVPIRIRKSKRNRERPDPDVQELETVEPVLLRPVPTSRDPILEGVDDKYVDFLLDAWDWS